MKRIKYQSINQMKNNIITENKEFITFSLVYDNISIPVMSIYRNFILKNIVTFKNIWDELYIDNYNIYGSGLLTKNWI